jgi:uncharacterized damage-inducible protein DinB
MLVTPDWCRMMARYNAWQNGGLLTLVAAMSEEELRRDRGAWFGSILGTLNHILWADRVWLGRIQAAMPDIGGIPTSVNLTTTPAAWAEARQEADQNLSDWAAALAEADIARDLTWTSFSGGPPRTQPMGVIVTHMFNHQTHHRGQVHAMLTAAGLRPPATDLVAMPL